MDTTAPATTGYPIVLSNLAAVRCVVIGGGQVAERKVAGLLEGGAIPLVVSPNLTTRLGKWGVAGKIYHERRSYRLGDLSGAFLAITASSDPQVDKQVAIEAARLGILVNVASSERHGTFQTPATARHGNLQVSVSTGGTNPSLAAHMRDELENHWTPNYARIVAITEPLRGELQKLEGHLRRRFWQEVTDPQTMDDLSCLSVESARAHLRDMLATLGETTPTREAYPVNRG
jgi:siroheme synthase-like protein